jgi:hypothetical protein
MALDVVPLTASRTAPPSLVGSTLEALPGVLRLSAPTVAHTAGWSVAAYARTASRVVRAVLDPDEAAALSDDLSVVTGQITEFAKSVARGGPISEAMERWGLPALERTRLALEQRGRRPGQEDEEQQLRREGEALLRRGRRAGGAARARGAAGRGDKESGRRLIALIAPPVGPARYPPGWGRADCEGCGL